MKPSRVHLLLLMLILLGALCLRIALIDRPFHRDSEGCGSFYGLLARNYWRYDWKATLGIPVMSMGIVDRPTLYPNHPPLVPVLIALVLGATGYREYSDAFPPDWLIRLPTVPFTMGCILLIWLILGTRASPRAALIACFLFAAIPMTIIYGGHPDVISPQLVFFMLLTVASYLGFVRQPNPWRFVLMCLAFLPGALTDWPAFLLVPVLFVHFALSRSIRQWGWMCAFAAICAGFFVIIYGQIALVTGEWLWMKRLIERRALSSTTDTNAAFTLWDWITKALVRHAVWRHTWIVMILGCGWVAWSLARWRRPVPAADVTGILLAWAALHIAIGRQGVFVHEWWWWPLTPGIVIAAGLMIDELLKRLEHRGMRPVALHTAVSVLLLVFAGWNSWKSFAELNRPARITTTDLDYSIVEIGEVIRQSTRPNTVVMLAEGDQSLSLWYYADRPLRYQVWEPGALHKRIDDGSSDLCFGISERHRGRAFVLIFPKAYRSTVPEFWSYLHARYPSHDSGKFVVFSLPQQKS